MPVANRHLILSKVETSPGQDANPTGADGVLVYAPRIEEDVTLQQRRPASFTLDRDIELIGRQLRRATFQQDFAGSGNVAVAPGFGKHLLACGFQQASVQNVTISALSGRFLLSEKVEVTGESDRWGIALNTATGTLLQLAWIAGAVPTAVDSLTGTASAATADVGSVTANNFAYRPDSDQLIELQTAAWSGGSAPAVGDHVIFQTGGNTVGGGTVISKTSDTQFKVDMQWGVIAATYTVATAAGASTTASTVTATNVPSLSIYSYRVNKLRRLLGCRGDFTLRGANSESMRFEFTFTGQVGAHADAAFPSVGNLGSISPPRLLGAQIGVGIGDQHLLLRAESIEFAPQNSVGVIGDANQPGGIVGTSITDKNYELRVTFGETGYDSADLLKKMQDVETVRFGARFGTGPGNVMAIVAPRVQVTNVEDADSDGEATNVFRFAPRLNDFTGDDSIVLAQTS